MSIANVLVVDDDIALCRIIDRMLSDEQYKVQTAQSVSGALSAISRNSFDVYALDYRLLDGSGFDVAKRIWSKWSDAPIILMSSYDRGSFAFRAEKLRISEFIEKPFSREMIRKAVEKAIGSPPSVAATVLQSQAVEKKRQKVISRIVSRF